MIRRWSLIAGAIALVGASQVWSAEDFSWAEKLHASGEFTYRQQYQNEEGQRNRSLHQIKLRGSLLPELSSQWRLGFGLTTSAGGLSGSSFVTLGDSASKKSIYLDLAYLEFHEEGEARWKVRAGKQPMPFFRAHDSQLVFDSDTTPEGISLGYLASESLNWRIFSSFGGYWISEREFAADSAYLNASVGVQGPWISIGANYFHFMQIQGYSLLASTTQSYGNSTDGNSRYLYDYRVWNLGVDAHFELINRTWSVFSDWIINQAKGGDQGIYFGIQCGELHEKGDWIAKIAYLSQAPDSAIGAFGSSDLFNMRTGLKGYQLSGIYRLFDKVDFKGSFLHYRYELGSARIPSQSIQLDLIAKF